MKKLCFTGMLLMISSAVYSQVGVNTPNPASSLDVMAKNPTGTTRNVDGLLVPRVDRQRAQSMTGIPVSTLIYVNSIDTGTASGTAININETGYYYFDGTVWTKLKTPAGGPSTNVNIYNSDGTLTSNRTVTQGANSLTFNSTAVNGFSVDGNTFSIDAANNQIGMGTTAPTGKLDIVSDNIGSTSGNDIYFNGYGNSKSPGLFLGSAGGTLAAPTNLTNGDNIGGLYFNGRIGGGWQYTGSGLSSVYKGDGNSNLTDLRFNNSGVERAIIDEKGNMGLGTSTPHVNALLEVTSTSKGILPPRMTTAQRDAINPKSEGLTIYNLTEHCLQTWNASLWTGDCDGTVVSPSITSLNCGSASFSPSTITAGVFYSGTMTVPYTGGNGQTYAGGSSVSSTGVTGLTATLQSGTLANGSGNLIYTVSGTPSGSGTANFVISFNGASGCTVQKIVTAVASPSITTLNCGSTSFNPSTMTAGTPYVGTMRVPYIGGNGQSYPAGAPFSCYSGPGFVNGLTAKLQAGTLANGAGELVYDVTGTPSGAGQIAFYIQFNGASSCYAYTSAGSAPTILPSVTSLFCSSASFSPSTITQGVYYSGTITVPYSGGNGQSYTGGSSYTVNGLTVTLQGGTLANGSGNFTYTVTGTPTNSGTFNFPVSFNGASSCNVQKTVSAPPVVSPHVALLYCGSATFNPSTLTAGVYYSGTMTVPYANGNGQSYPGGSQIFSTGVTGLTATLQAGTLNSGGTGYLTYTVTGTPSSSGTANFAVSFYDASPCTVQKQVNAGTVTPPNPPTTVCSSLYGQSYAYGTTPPYPPTFPMTTNIGGNSVTVTMSTNTVENNGYFNDCGISMPYNSFLIGGTRSGGNYYPASTSTTFHFSRPVSNIELAWAGVWPNYGNRITITASNGGVPVAPNLSLLGSCTGLFSISGNQVINTGGQNQLPNVAIIAGGTYYTDLTVTSGPQTSNGSSLAIGFCTGTSQ